MCKKYWVLARLLAGTGAAQAQETLKRGAVLALSGPGAAWGQGMQYAAQFAADGVNAKGGLEVGGKKYKVEIIAYDDKYQANEAVTAVNRLIFEDKVQYVIGPTGSAPALARSEEHTSELQSLMRISYAVFCLKKKKNQISVHRHSRNDQTRR